MSSQDALCRLVNKFVDVKTEVLGLLDLQTVTQTHAAV
jgi:hypothetical protein